MKTIHVSFLGKVFSDQRGQTLVWMGFLLVALMATGGFTVDVGHYYMVRSDLKAMPMRRRWRAWLIYSPPSTRLARLHLH